MTLASALTTKPVIASDLIKIAWQSRITKNDIYILGNHNGKKSI